ncbi:unnamed protein product, partial [Amoebophrya sp. A25]|eukprot:GSA25T00026661001.1
MMHSARIVSVRDVTAKVRWLELQLLPPSSCHGTQHKLTFRPGQWADFALPLTSNFPAVGGYSYVSAPQQLAKQQIVEFLVQKEQLPRPHTMTNWIHSTSCVPGVEVELRTGGNFVVDDGSGTFADVDNDQTETRQAPAETHLVAAGIGITPFLSFLRAAQWSKRTLDHVFLAYAVRHKEDAVFLDKIEEMVDQNGLQFRLLESGRLGRKLAVEDFLLHSSHSTKKQQDKNSSTKYYLCGPPEFSISMEKQMRSPKYGIKNIFYENWWSPNPHGRLIQPKRT